MSPPSPDGDPYGVSLVAGAFASLKTKRARRNALDQLLDLLQPEELRRVHGRASKSLQRDIIGCLPLELVAIITTYLKPWDILILQRVSKQWQVRLSSKAVYYSVLRHYFAPEPEKSMSTEGFRMFAEQRYRLETGSPYYEAFYGWEHEPDYSPVMKEENLLSYCSRRIAWVSKDSNRALVRDLQTGTVTDFVSETRGKITAIHVTETFLFVEASGYCTVWNLSTRQSSSVKIPSSRLFEVNIRGNNVALILQSASKYSLYRWNLISGTLRSVDLLGHPLLTYWDEGANVITVVELRFPERLYYSFFGTKYSTADENLILVESKLVGTKPRHAYWGPITSDYERVLCRYGTIVVIQHLIPLDDAVAIIYYGSTNQLKIFSMDKGYIGKENGIYTDRSKLILPDGLVYSPSDGSKIWVDNIFKPETGGQYANFPKPVSPAYFYNSFTFFQTFGNHQLYGLIGSEGISVWSFDPNLKPYGASVLPFPPRMHNRT